MDRWKQLLDEAQEAAKRARQVAEKAQNEDRSFTDQERKQFDDDSELAQSKKTESDQAKADTDRMNSVMALSNAEVERSRDDSPAKSASSLGDHFVKTVGDELTNRKQRFSISAPEFKMGTKVNTDPQVTGGDTGVWGDVLTQVDRRIVEGKRRKLTIADLLSTGTISGQAITYFVEGAMEGDFATVAESGTKPQIHFADPTKTTESLSKVAGFIKESDEMIEDLPFVVSSIDNRLLYQLQLFEEDQLLTGDGVGTNLTGILNRSGIQTMGATTDAAADNANQVFRAMTSVQTGSNLNADAIVMHPTDYQTFRLMRDSNGQYYGGGFFQGQYGDGQVMAEPPMWGLQTVVTPAIASGTVLVGAFATGATVYRKGSVRVEMSNSNQDDFINNLVTIRAEERLALAVRVPAGFVNLTLGTA